MAGLSGKGGRPERTGGLFATTHWSLVRAAGGSESPETSSALETLCRTYWYPVYAHVRFRGHNVEDARDLTQEFFARLLRYKTIGRADPDRGRFRSFILGSLKHVLCDAHDYARAKKRGGDSITVSWDQERAEDRFAHEARDGDSPDIVFERSWATALLERAANRLYEEYRTSDRDTLFEGIKGYIASDGSQRSCSETAAKLGLSLSATRSAIFRLRRRYHEIIRDEVAQTLEDPAETDDELRHLLQLFGSPTAGP